MKAALSALLALSLLGSASCKGLHATSAEKAPLSGCLEDLKAIPHLAALLKSRASGGDEDEGQPLQGVEIALTINGMVRSQGEPEKGEDNWCAAENSRDNFDKIVAALKENRIPPTVDFVIGRLHDESLIRPWLGSGNLVGSLSYDRKKLHKRPAQVVIDDVDRNDQMLAPYLREFHQKGKYFRFPGLKPSRDPETKKLINAHLAEKGYVDAPATIEALDKNFSGPYCAAAARGDQDCVNLVNAYFKSLLMSSSVRARAAARRIVGRDIKHILVIRANQFTCDNLGEILAWYKSLGVRFISLDEALRDPVYAVEDAKGRSISRAILHASRRTEPGDVEPQ